MEKIVNHPVSDTLDSTGAFEGPEKLLRLKFCGPGNLLDVAGSIWDEMLELVQCKVLSIMKGPQMSAYVLSESSMFVYSHQFVLKTCGTTTLLEGLASILSIAASQSLTVSEAMYSRRSFLFPEKQAYPHSSWEAEVSRLRSVFPQGSTATFGTSPCNRWHLFAMLDSSQQVASKSSPWFEMIMTELNPAIAQRFCLGSPAALEDSVVSLDSISTIASECCAEPDNEDPGHACGNIMTRVTRIDEIYPNMRQTIDSFAFNPCGYSCNGVVTTASEDTRYFTSHVTPEAGCSYASFESTVSTPTPEIVERILEIFEPSHFVIVAFSADFPISLANGRYLATSEAHVELGSNVLTHMNYVQRV